MLIKERYISPNSSEPLIKVYSDKGFFIEYNGLFYTEVIVANLKEAEKYIESSAAIPAPIADEYFVYNNLIGPYQNITQEQIIEAKKILLEAFKSLDDEKAYKIKFFFENWAPGKNYEVGERILYNGELYNVIQNIFSDEETPEESIKYIKTSRPINLIEEWNDDIRKVYNAGDKMKMGNYIYQSLIDNNSWSPREFPAGWIIVE